MYPHALTDCGNDITEHLAYFSKRMDDMVHMPHWEKQEEKIYAEYKAVIDQNTEYEFKTWKERVYFNSGMFAGETDKIFLDNKRDTLSVEEEGAIRFFHPFV